MLKTRKNSWFYRILKSVNFASLIYGLNPLNPPPDTLLTGLHCGRQKSEGHYSKLLVRCDSELQLTDYSPKLRPHNCKATVVIRVKACAGVLTRKKDSYRIRNKMHHLDLPLPTGRATDTAHERHTHSGVARICCEEEQR